jgi:hypothetical protein
MRALNILGLVFAALAESSAALAQSVYTNADGSLFTVHLDPRTRPRMRVDEVIAFTEEAARTSSGERSARAQISRIELVLGEELELVMPYAPLQERGRWYWVVWLRGKFRGGSGPGTPESEGSRGWALYDDEHRVFIAGGFQRDPPLAAPEPSPHSL